MSIFSSRDMEGLTAINMPYYSDFLSTTHYKMVHHGAKSSNMACSNRAIQSAHEFYVYITMADIITHAVKLSVECGGIYPHTFTCFGPRGEPYDGLVYHRIYNIAPRKNTLCLIQLDFYSLWTCNHRILLWRTHVLCS